eukprot:3806651-Ditylum_brightwellii.AAC.1
MPPKPKMRGQTATAEAEGSASLVPGFNLAATTKCLEDPVITEGDDESLDSLPVNLQPTSDAEREAEGEGAQASLSFAHGSGTGGQGSSLGSGTPRLASTALAPFANTPAQISPTLLINYSSPSGMKVWVMVIEGLVTKFDCKEVSLYLFVEEVRRRAEMDPLSDCITIQVGHATYSVLTEYGRMNMEDITKYARRQAAVQPWNTYWNSSVQTTDVKDSG